MKVTNDTEKLVTPLGRPDDEGEEGHDGARTEQYATAAVQDAGQLPRRANGLGR